MEILMSMFNAVLWIATFATVGVGIGILWVLWPAIWILAYQLLVKLRLGKVFPRPLPPKESFLSPSSIPAILNSRDVFSFMAALSNNNKRQEYLRITDTIKQLLLDIDRHSSAYPTNVATFFEDQVMNMVAKSSIRSSVESKDFTKLLLLFIAGELERLDREGLPKNSRVFHKKRGTRRDYGR